MRWNKVDKSYWDFKENLLMKNIIIYRTKGKLYPMEIIISELTDDGIKYLEEIGIDANKKFLVNLYKETTPTFMSRFSCKDDAINYVNHFISE